MSRKFNHLLAKALVAAVASLQLAMMPATGTEPAGAPDFYLLGSVGNLSASETQAVAQSIYGGLKNHSEFVDLSGLGLDASTDTQDAVFKVYMSVVGGYDVGMLAEKNAVSTRLYGYADAMLINGISISYLVDDADYAAKYGELSAALDTICAGVDPAWSVPEKALYLHEYLGTNYDYSPEGQRDDLSHTAYGMLERGHGVCEAYTWLYSILLHRVGIENQSVISKALNHTWNVIYIDGAWYHTDVTWDDLNDGHPGYMEHRNFLKSSDSIRDKHASNDWFLSTGASISDLEISDKYDNAFWNDTNAVINYYQNEWLCIVPDQWNPTTGHFKLYSFNAATAEAESTEIAAQTQQWPFLKTTQFWRNCFIFTAVNDGTIYYTTPTTLMAFHNGQHVWICNLTEEQKGQGDIYGIRAEGDTLYFYISETYLDETHEYAILLDDYRSRIYAQAGTPMWVERTSKYVVDPNAVMPTEAPTEATTEATTTTQATTTTTTTTKATTTTTKATTKATTTTTKVTTKATTTTTKATTKATTTTTKATTKATTTTTKATTKATTTTTKATTKATTTTTKATTKATTTTTKAANTTTTKATTTATTKATTATTQPPTEAPTQAPTYIAGDADGDGKVEVMDVIMVTRYLLNSAPPKMEEIGTDQLDMNGDDVIDVFDLALIKRVLLRQMTK